MKSVSLLVVALFLATLFLSGCGDMFGGNQEYKYSKFYLYKMNPDGSNQEKIRKIESEPTRIIVSADEKFMAVSNQNIIEVIDLETGETQKEIELYSGSSTFDFSSNSKYMMYTTQSYINYYDLYSGELDQIWDHNLGDYPIFADSTTILYTTYTNSNGNTLFKELDLQTGSDNTIYSCATYDVVKSFNIEGDDLYFMFQGEESCNTYKVLRKVDLQTGESFDFNSSIGGDFFNISPNGEYIIGSNNDSQNRIRIFSTDGMDCSDTYVGRSPIFVDNENILFEKENDVYYGKLDGSLCNEIIENGAMYYSEPQNGETEGKVYYIKEKKVYE